MSCVARLATSQFRAKMADRKEFLHSLAKVEFTGNNYFEAVEHSNLGPSLVVSEDQRYGCFVN
jgi:hypothetical protein